jgi:hypothetical protein
MKKQAHKINFIIKGKMEGNEVRLLETESMISTLRMTQGILLTGCLNSLVREEDVQKFYSDYQTKVSHSGYRSNLELELNQIIDNFLAPTTEFSDVSSPKQEEEAKVTIYEHSHDELNSKVSSNTYTSLGKDGRESYSFYENNRLDLQGSDWTYDRQSQKEIVQQELNKNSDDGLYSCNNLRQRDAASYGTQFYKSQSKSGEHCWKLIDSKQDEERDKYMGK